MVSSNFLSALMYQDEFGPLLGLHYLVRLIHFIPLIINPSKILESFLYDKGDTATVAKS